MKLKPEVTLAEVALNENFASNVMSVSRICDTGAHVLFTKDKAIITKDGEHVMTIPRQGKLWVHDQVMSMNDTTQETNQEIKIYRITDTDTYHHQAWKTSNQQMLL